jgi:lysophospholipase L1-like esterase
MTSRRLLWMVAVFVGAAGCGGSATGTSGTSGDIGPVPVELASLPTSPSQTTLPATIFPITPTIAEPSSTRPRNTSAPLTTVATTIGAPSSTTAATVGRTAPTTTSCTDVAYIGDSVSLGMISAATLPDPAARLEARLAAIGIDNLQVEISGGRSIVETLPGQENAVDVAVRLRSNGFSGCWVIAVGTNDAANIAAGAARHADQRIVALMSVIGADPVLWVDARTIATTGFWASANIVAWDDALTTASVSYPNIRIARWSKFVKAEWFASDGIHPNAAGTSARVQFVVAALVANYPKK